MYIPLRFETLNINDRRSKRNGGARFRNENCRNRLVLRRCSLALSVLSRIPRKTPDPAAYGKCWKCLVNSGAGFLRVPPKPAQHPCTKHDDDDDVALMVFLGLGC